MKKVTIFGCIGQVTAKVSINIGGGQHDVRIQDNDIDVCNRWLVFNNFAAPGAKGDAAANKERAVRADLRNQPLKSRVGQVQVPEFVEANHRASRVRTAAAQAGPVGNVLFQVNLCAAGRRVGFAQDFGGAINEVFLRRAEVDVA